MSIVWTIISPVIKYQSVLKFGYFPPSKIGIPCDVRFALERTTNQPVFKN